MYLMPPFMSPFSTMETIKEEKKAMTEIAIKENVLKSSGFTLVFENLKGEEAMFWVAPESWPMKLRIIRSSWKESAKSKGLITTTMTEMKITYAIADADISFFNFFVSFRLSTNLSISWDTLPPLSISLIIKSIVRLSINELYLSARSVSALLIS